MSTGGSLKSNICSTIWLSLSDCCSVVSSVVSNGRCCWNQHRKALIACWCGIDRWGWRCWKGRRLHHNWLVSTHCAYFRRDCTPLFNSCHRSRGRDWRGHFGIDNLLRGQPPLLRWLTFWRFAGAHGVESIPSEPVVIMLDFVVGDIGIMMPSESHLWWENQIIETIPSDSVK